MLWERSCVSWCLKYVYKHATKGSMVATVSDHNLNRRGQVVAVLRLSIDQIHRYSSSITQTKITPANNFNSCCYHPQTNHGLQHIYLYCYSEFHLWHFHKLKWAAEEVEIFSQGTCLPTASTEEGRYSCNRHISRTLSHRL